MEARNLFTIFLDETGVVSLKSGQSPLYVLSGCALNEENRYKAKIKADQIKFKYWGRTDIVFHSEELGKDNGIFSIFKQDLKRKRDFQNDLFQFLRDVDLILFSVVLNKQAARNKGWNEIKVTKEIARSIFQNFICFLKGEPSRKGKIVIESSDHGKDFSYLAIFDNLLSSGIPNLNVSHQEVKEKITSISFVTKRNNDIEEQIADLLAYGIKCKYDEKYLSKNFNNQYYESNLIKIIDSKLFKGTATSKIKQMFYGHIVPFQVIP